ncbi:MAG: glutamate--tRNA ligase, partial [Alphaproteobacteria bacterium]|nr:glutamate--tRNA ligase [Alphaproteobacteria bacterium]
MAGVIARFAPSPTGYLHVGNARTALFNWLFAAKHGGTFVLRLDDTDAERSRTEYAAAIAEDLAWLGLVWQVSVRQSERLAHYREAFERLRTEGRVYPCYETPEELEALRARRAARGLPPLYDRAALALGAAERGALEASGRRAHWRFALAAGEVAWDDLVRGATRIAAAAIGDPVVVREDGVPLYLLSSVVDDVALGITHVIRGEDHVSNTAAQIQIFHALGAAPPAFAHHALLIGPAGEKLSKRLAGAGIRAWRQAGLEPLALASLLAKLGTAEPVVPRQSLGELAVEFDLGHLGRAPARFDPEELRRLNHRLLAAMPYDLVRPRLAAGGLVAADEAFWLAVRGNLATVADAATWWAVCRGEVVPRTDDPDLLGAAAATLSPRPWDDTTWGRWTAALA